MLILCDSQIINRSMLQFQKLPVPPVECPVCKIQLSSQQVYVTHVEGKAHKKKLIIQEKEKRAREDNAPTRPIVTKMPDTIPVIARHVISTNTSITSNVIANTFVPVESDIIMEHTALRSTESNLNPPLAKKKKKNKVIRSNCCIHLKLSW